MNTRVPAKTQKEAPAHVSRAASDELSHGSSPSSMTCSRPDPAPAPDRRFDPDDVLGFLHDAAVSVPAAIEEPARALRLSGQAYRYRHFVSLCRTSEVDEGFRPERLLGFVRDIAVSFGDGEGESAVVRSHVAQLDSFRRFVSVQPRWSWSYEQDLEVEDEDESQGSDQEISGSSSTSEEAYEEMDEFEDDDISTATQEEVFEHKMQDGRVICVTNGEDFSLLDEDYDSTLSTYEAVEHRCRSSGEDSFGGENAKNKSQESEIDAYVEDHAEANETEFVVNEKTIGHFPSHVTNDLCENIADLRRHEVVVKSEINVAIDRFSEKTTETSRLKQDDSFAYVAQSIPVPEDKSLVAPTSLSEILPKSISCNIFKSNVSVNAIGSDDTPKEVSQGLLVEKIMLGQPVLADVGHNNIDSSILAIQSARNCLPSSPSIRQLFRDPANDPEATSGNGMLSSQHCTEDNIHFSSKDSNRGENSNNTSDSMNRNFTPLSRNTAYATHSKTRTVDEEVSKKFTSHDKKRKIRSLDIPRHSSKSDKERIGYHSANSLKRRRLYGTSLTRDKPKSPSLSNERKKKSATMDTDASSALPVQAARIVSCTNGGSHQLAADHFNGHRVYASASTTDRFSDIPKSLHMKFPRNFNLPSKQALAKKFQVFGQLDHLRVFAFTGAAQVVFLHEADAWAAYAYVKRKSIFGSANVRFWFDEHENYRKGNSAVSARKAPSVNLKSCLKKPVTDKKEKFKVRFSI